MESSILLESGTGEVEVLHFLVAQQNYAINVIKVKELWQLKNISKIPNSPPSVAGVTLNRGEMITIVDLNYVLEGRPSQNILDSMILLCEFNQLKVGFAIDSVSRIYKIGWNRIVKPDNVSANQLVIGNIDLDGLIVMLLDFEKIVMDISPSTGIHEDQVVEETQKDRSHYKVMIVDDSPTIRQAILQVLTKAGVTNVKVFENGKTALDYLENLVALKGENFLQDISLMVTDIEMPVMDGHALTRKVKEHKILKALPIVIFSSLITESLRHKGESVGADAQMSKPEIGKLLGEIDRLLNNK